MPHLLIAHPGHELLLHGWITRTKPTVHVLTDGSAHASEPRLGRTAEFLRGAGARCGAIFGPMTDREAYAMIAGHRTDLLLSFAADLASQLERDGTSMVVVDAMEGYNPVHDLCRLIAGAAIDMAGVDAKLYEYAVVAHPQSLRAAMSIDLDDAEHDAKMAHARSRAGTLPDVDEMLSRFGEAAFRRESFALVGDWTDVAGDAPPLYERIGEERVAAGRYAQVIRLREHMLPLRDALRATARQSRAEA